MAAFIAEDTLRRATFSETLYVHKNCQATQAQSGFSRTLAPPWKCQTWCAQGVMKAGICLKGTGQ